MIVIEIKFYPKKKLTQSPLVGNKAVQYVNNRIEFQVPTISWLITCSTMWLIVFIIILMRDYIGQANIRRNAVDQALSCNNCR